MDSEAGRSSWHPASMPNGVPHPRASDGHVTSHPPAAEPSPEPLDRNTAHDSKLHDFFHHDEDGHDAGDAPLSHDGDGDIDGDRDGGAGLALEAPASQHHALVENDREAPAPSDEQHTKPASGRSAPTSAQHSSSMSFARTVSHEVSFNDDDDDWSLSRTDTDPFKFMSPTERTNSFPVVPLMAADPENQGDVHLPSNQALDVLEETERDFDFEEQEYQAGGSHLQTGSDAESEEPEPSRAKHAPSRSIGSEVQWPEAAAAEARYEEGVPLIPHPHPSDMPNSPADGAGGGGFIASFDDDGDDSDDFFNNQTHESGFDTTTTGAEIRSPQRKSTMQVLAAIDSEPLSRQSTLDQTLEEDEDEGMQEYSGMTETPDHQNDQQGVPPTEDLASKWQEAFAGDDDEEDFLLDGPSAENKELDAAAFLGSDDEGLLDDTEEAPSTSQPAPETSQSNTVTPSPAQGPSPHIPVHQQTAAYTPVAAAHAVPNSSYDPSHPAASYSQAPQLPQIPQPQLQAPPEPHKAQSFVDKSRAGYVSPFDLPADLVTTTVKPRKRASMQQLQRDTSSSHQPSPPPRSASMNAVGGPPPPSGPSPTSAQMPGQKPPAPVPRNKDNFFEDLPIVTKPRPSSRQSQRAVSPSPYAPPGQHSHVPSPAGPPVPGPTTAPANIASPGMNLVAPERVSPYAPLQSSHSAMPLPRSASRYSPAPASAVSSHSAPPPPVASRYSPAPPAARPINQYPALSTAASQPVLPHLPRTSSPLAHFEISSEKAHGINGDVGHPERRASSSYEPRVNRVSSLPPTREVEEEEDEEESPSGRAMNATSSPPARVTEGRYSPAPPPSAARRTPPPSAPLSHSVLSPPKRPGSSYLPQAPPPGQQGFVPPPRAQTQSPGATRGGRHISRSSDSSRRPASAHSPTSPVLAKSTHTSPSHPRPLSQTMDMIAPTDGREHDPLQRWRGVPVFSWGVGGTIVTSFPKSIPRYVMHQTTPSMLRTSGEVKVRNIKDIEPLQERLARFPGPLKGKSKKKEVLMWLVAGIDSLAREVPDVSIHPQLTLEDKRTIERLLLWRILRVFVEYDGVLEGNPVVDKMVRDILSPGTVTPAADNDSPFPLDPSIGINGTAVTAMQADGADPAVTEQIRHHLLRGDRETAVWSAVDKRLWGHAMLISHTVSPDLYKRVAQEFVRKEVNHPGHSNESLAALYKILSGNYDDCVDELVPVHARAGLQLVSTESTSGPAKDAMDGLDKWRETLILVLSNRSVDDIRGLNALGKLLSSYGRAEAAHICFIFSRHISIFGGLDDPNVDYVLLGSDHRQQSYQLARDTEALQLSEVYEYGLSLSGSPSVAAGAPHLAAYKLHHAINLAEYGHRDKALQYCDAIAAAMTSQTKRSHYHHATLEAALDDFMRRLKQAPKEESSSWMSKPSMNKVSDSMWNRFNKFVAGDEQENNGSGVGGELDNGPFARIGTPTMSRSPSVSNFETLGVGSPTYPPTSAPMAASVMSSRYAPAAAQPSGMPHAYDPPSPYQPSIISQAGRSSNEFSRSPYEPSHPGACSAAAQNSGYTPSGISYQPSDASAANGTPSTAAEYQPYGLGNSNISSSHHEAGDAVTGSSGQGYQPEPVSYGYQPPQMIATAGETENNDRDNEPPSFQPYGYEPPSHEPGSEKSAEDDDAPKPKKKSFMDDDEDDIPALKPQEKTKAEKDRENDELFRKAVEEDAKRAAAQAQQPAKKGWGFSSWFGGAKKDAGIAGDATNKPVRAKLGEASSFVYDPELKRWINRKPGAENTEVKTATPPPPRSAPRSVSGTPPPSSYTPPPPPGRASVPPPSTGGFSRPSLIKAPSQESIGGVPTMMAPPASAPAPVAAAVGPPSRPPSRPATSMSNASSIDDLLSTSAPRKPGQKKPRKSGRYVDVMAK